MTAFVNKTPEPDKIPQVLKTIMNAQDIYLHYISISLFSHRIILIWMVWMISNSFSLSLSLTLTHTLFLSISLSLYHSLDIVLIEWIATQFLSLSHTCTHSLSFSLSLYLSIYLCLYVSLSLSLYDYSNFNDLNE